MSEYIGISVFTHYNVLIGYGTCTDRIVPT